MKKFKSIFLLAALISTSLFSQTSVNIEVQNSSWIAIHGTTNVLPFKLVHYGDKLQAKTINVVATETRNRLYLSWNELSIAVKNFTSDNSMALRDFLKLIKSTVYPTIDVHLKYFESPPSKTPEPYSKGNAVVDISITGVTRQYKIPVSSNKAGDFISVKGGKRLSIRDFGLTPPVQMMGLIKVSEWIDIEFDIVCKLNLNGNLTQK
ncbi:MAG TPA: YceI family protein [Paludibacter sp.]|nr:YceI family protein [Paludibacter sp.]